MAKQKLIENVIVSTRLFERIETPLREAVVGDTKYEILAVFRFPFTRPGQKNLNGRIYLNKLWDRLFGMNITTVSLADHPEEGDGDPARIWAVMKNAGYSKDRTFGMVDCYIINNELGRTAMGVIAAGGDIGLSSSGIGDFEADGVTVDSNTYELERWADWVLNPSYAVFGRIDDQVKESVMSDTKNKEDLQESKTGEGMKTLSLREKREFEASLKKIYENVKEIGDIRERLSRAKEALTFYEGTDVDSYKKEFEDLVKEAEKDFESVIAKSEQADAAKKESEETSKKAEEVKKEADDLKKENEVLKKENAELKAKVEESKQLENESNGLLSAMTESMRRNISYEKYEELRQYAIKATKLYSEMKNDRNTLQIQIQEMQTTNKALEEAKLVQYQKDAAARARIEELRQRNAEAKTLSEKKLQEAKEAEFMRNVNPEVLEYYNDTLARGVNVSEHRTQILTKRTLEEAQLLVLRLTRTGTAINEATSMRDLSAPLPVKNCRQIMPDTPLNLPKGFI